MCYKRRQHMRLDGGKEEFDRRWGYETLQSIRENANQHRHQHDMDADNHSIGELLLILSSFSVVFVSWCFSCGKDLLHLFTTCVHSSFTSCHLLTWSPLLFTSSQGMFRRNSLDSIIDSADSRVID